MAPVEGSEGGADEVPEGGGEGAPAMRPASPPVGRPAIRGAAGRGAQRPTTAYRQVLPPDLGKEYLITELACPPPGVFALLGAKSKYEAEEKARNEAATIHAKQKVTFDGDDVDSDDNDWVEDDGGLVEEGIIPSGMCSQQ